jgi:DNA-binding Xre family transcriptional regulator
VARLSVVTLRVPYLMEKAGITAYRLAADSAGRISRRSAYRLSTGEKAALYPDEIAALCDVLDVQPGELFDISKGKR